MNTNTLEKCFVQNKKGNFVLEFTPYAKDKLIQRLRSVDKTRIKLKSMEIAFELINNDRNRLIHQVAVLEQEFEDNAT